MIGPLLLSMLILRFPFIAEQFEVKNLEDKIQSKGYCELCLATFYSEFKRAASHTNWLPDVTDERTGSAGSLEVMRDVLIPPMVWPNEFKGREATDQVGWIGRSHIKTQQRHHFRAGRNLIRSHTPTVLLVLDANNIFVNLRNKTYWLKGSFPGAAKGQPIELGKEIFVYRGIKQHQGSSGRPYKIPQYRILDRQRLEKLYESAWKKHGITVDDRIVNKIVDDSKRFFVEQQKRQVRQWRNERKRKTFSGSFVSRVGKRAKIRVENGRIVSIPLEDLADESALFVEQLTKLEKTLQAPDGS